MSAIKAKMSLSLALVTPAPRFSRTPSKSPPTTAPGVLTNPPTMASPNPQATLIRQLSYDDVLQQGLRIMDHAAISLCRDNKIPIVVLNIFRKGNIARTICGERVGTLITHPTGTPSSNVVHS